MLNIMMLPSYPEMWFSALGNFKNKKNKQTYRNKTAPLGEMAKDLLTVNGKQQRDPTGKVLRGPRNGLC